ncbi:MAG: chitobiase/beta-hexosaminidase C-terminal domain-containing protein, partial [Spirochaetia bacterium]|nr:chitobiase/beta-hexosaminidase C-terminal domain-containing protein [Spirochaetia bacterium]
MLNAIYNAFSDQERIIVFDPDKSKVQIILDAKSLLFPTDPAQYNGDPSSENPNTDIHPPEMINHAKDKPLKCRDLSIPAGHKDKDDPDGKDQHNQGYTYPFQGQCLKPIDKLALNVTTIELINVSHDYAEPSDSDSGRENDSVGNDDDHKTASYTVVATLLNNTTPALVNINSDGILTAEGLIDLVSFNGVKFTFADGSQLVYKNGIQRTTKSLKLKNLDQPAITDKITLQASYVTAVNMALDNAKLSFGAIEAKNTLQGIFRYRSINTFEGAYAYVQKYESSPDGVPKVPLPLNVDQTAAEYSRQLALMPGRTYIAEDAVNPKVYHAMIYIDNLKQKSLLKVLGIVYDYFPLFGNNTGTTQPGGIIDMSQHLKGFFVYALVNDFQYNLMLCFHLFKAFDVLEQITYQTLAQSGYHMAPEMGLPSEFEMAEADTFFQSAINNGVVFPTPATAIGTLNVNQRSWNLWSGIQRAFRNIVRVVVDAVIFVAKVIIAAVTFIARGLLLIFNSKGRIKGLIGFKNQDSTAYMKRGYHFYLPGTSVSIRNPGFILNGVDVVSSADGYFDSGLLASSSGGKTIQYTIRLTLENSTARVFNINPLWPMVIDLKSDAKGNPAQYAADNKVHEILPYPEPHLFVYGVINFAAKRSKEMFNFQPDQASVIVGGIVTMIKSGIFTPTGHLASVINTLIALGYTALPFFLLPLIEIAAPILGLAQLDGDIYFSSATWSEGTITHEYGHYVMTNKIDQKFLVSSVDGLLINYVLEYSNSGVGPSSPRMTLDRFWEAWAEFFAFNALSTKTGTLDDVQGVQDRINGYFSFPPVAIDGVTGLELNMGSPATYFDDTSQQTREGVGRDASIFQDLYDSNTDTDSTSGQSDQINLGSGLLQAVVDYAPWICAPDLLNISNGQPCNYNMAGFYSFLPASGAKVDATKLMHLYQMHGIIFQGDSPTGNLISYSPSTNTMNLQQVSPASTIQLIGVNQNDITWKAGALGDYFVQVSGDCMNGKRSNGANASGSVFLSLPITSTILNSDLIEGPNTISICVTSFGVMEKVNFQIIKDTTPPVVTVNPPGGTCTGTQNVTITCNDGNGSGCNQIVYTKDGSAPTLDPSLATQNNHIVSGNNAYVTVACNETLKFFATDKVGLRSTTTPSASYIVGASCLVSHQSCVDQYVCNTTSVTVENSACWVEFFGHHCICGSQALWPLSEQPC